MEERYKGERYLRVTREGEQPLYNLPITGLQATFTEVPDGYQVNLTTMNVAVDVAVATVEEPPALIAVEVFKGKDGWYFRTVWSNGKTDSRSESYTRRDSARKAARKVAEQLGLEVTEV